MLAAALVHLQPTDQVLLLPTQSVGLSSEHLAYDGTMSFSPASVIEQWCSLGESVARAGLKKLLLEKEALLRECADKLSQTEVVLYAVIRKFRIENEIAREDGLRPSYFDSLPSLSSVSLPRVDHAKENALLEALEQDIKTYESNVNAQREKVYALYEQSISRLNHLKYH